MTYVRRFSDTYGAHGVMVNTRVCGTLNSGSTPDGHPSMFKKIINFLSTCLNKPKGMSARMFKSMKAKADAKRSPYEILSDWLTEVFGSMTFLVLNALLFIFWFVVNTHTIKAIPAFDPFPFSLLTTAVSLEAIFLAIIVLISQNRSSKLGELREELHLQVNLIAEKEITQVTKMLSLLLKKEGIDLSQDQQLKESLKPIQEDKIEEKLENEIAHNDL